MQSLANVGTDEIDALQALLAMTGEDFADVVSFVSVDPLEELEAITQ